MPKLSLSPFLASLKAHIVEGLRRRPSHAGLENPRTPASPIHSGPLPVRRAGPQLCFGHGTSEGIFFPCASRGSNPRPGGFHYRTPTSRASAHSPLLPLWFLMLFFISFTCFIIVIFMYVPSRCRTGVETWPTQPGSCGKRLVFSK